MDPPQRVGAREAPRPSRPSVWRRLGVEPALRLAAWALRALLGRAGLALRAPFEGIPAREARRRDWTRRVATALVTVLGRLKGAFVKAGQFASHRHDLVPAEAAAPLETLRDRVPPLDFAVIRGVVESELGAPLPSLFAAFDPNALAAASVAQVHRARLPGGQEVAVKVQYPWLEAALPADLALLRLTLSVGSRWLGRADADPLRLSREFEAGLREELDFEREAETAREIAANLAHDPQIVVPEVFPSHSSRRVLTLAFHAAIRISDRDGLARLGASPRDVLEVVARAYAKQVFVDGLFHADPHPGNLFVLDEPGAGEEPRVLFVDFGLSRRLDPRLRREMREGVHALIRRDLEGFVAGMNRMGMIAPGAEPRVRDAVKHMQERVAAAGGLGLAGDSVLGLKDEAVALLRETPGLQLPDDLLLFAKTLSYVFALGRELSPETDLMRLTLPYLMRFLATQD